jgi:hypothetical protein
VALIRSAAPKPPKPARERAGSTIIASMRHARLTTLLIAALTAVSLVGPAQAAGHRVVMHLGFLYKPHEFAVSGDGDFLARALRWQSWGGPTAVATGHAVEQQRPSHVDHTYPVRVTLSERTFCANLHRTVYNQVVAQILGPNPGVFGSRTLGRVYTCAGTWRLVSPPPTPTSPSRALTRAHRCSTAGVPLAVVTITARDCARARMVVREWFHRLKTPGGSACIVPDGSSRPAVCRVRTWRCTSLHTVDGHTYPVTCTAAAGRRRVHFVNRV